MWIVKVALNRPYTFLVLALLILIISPVVILRTPTDIFPNINIAIDKTIATKANPANHRKRMSVISPFRRSRYRIVALICFKIGDAKFVRKRVRTD